MDNERYERILEETKNRTFNGNFSRGKHLEVLLKAIWPDRDFGFYNDEDFSVVTSDRGGAWTPLTAAEWEGNAEWNEVVALRHGITESNGVLKIGMHNICWRPHDFAQKLFRISRDKDEARFSARVASEQQREADAKLGKHVTKMEFEKNEYEPAKVRPDPIHSDPEELKQRKLQVSVPSTYKRPPVQAKRGRKPKVMPVPVDKTGNDG